MKETPSGSDQPLQTAVAPAAQGPAAGAGGGDLAPGTLVGEYRIEQELGRGGMGTVYAARHPVIGKRVAIKVLGERAVQRPGAGAALRRRGARGQPDRSPEHHRHLRLRPARPPDRPQHYFVMEYLDGETLAARLARSPPIADGEACRLLVQTAARSRPRIASGSFTAISSRRTCGSRSPRHGDIVRQGARLRHRQAAGADGGAQRHRDRGR